MEYDLAASFTAPDGSYHLRTTARLALRFDGGAWSGTCSGATVETLDGVTTQSEWSSPSGGHPAVAPSGLQRGSTIEASLLDEAGVAEGCRQRGGTVEVVGRQRHATAMEDGRGRPVMRSAWMAEGLPEASQYQDVSIAWDQDSGLALDWARMVRGGSSTGRLVATDAFTGG